MLCKSLILNYF